jgi:hypothetical protein
MLALYNIGAKRGLKGGGWTMSRMKGGHNRLDTARMVQSIWPLRPVLEAATSTLVG